MAKDSEEGGALFQAATGITIGEEANANFWTTVSICKDKLQTRFSNLPITGNK
jgi:hypothetical protein